jgi:hypothetical protein
MNGKEDENREYWTPTWEHQLREARKLYGEELRKYANVSKDNNHRCKDCFCCACLEVEEERRISWIFMPLTSDAPRKYCKECLAEILIGEIHKCKKTEEE